MMNTMKYLVVAMLAINGSSALSGILLEETFETGFSDDTLINGINGWTGDSQLYSDSSSVPSHGTYAVRTVIAMLSSTGSKTFSAVVGGETDFYARQFIHFNGLNELSKWNMARFWISDGIGGLFGTGSAYLQAGYNKYAESPDKWYVTINYWYKDAAETDEVNGSKRFWYDPSLNNGLSGAIDAPIGSRNDVWYEIQITYDTAAKTVSWDIREEDGTWINIDTHTSASTTWTPARININTGNNLVTSTAVACLDDILVRQGPVPAAGTVIVIH